MNKKSALFDTEEFNITDAVEQTNTDVVVNQSEHEPVEDTKPKYLRLALTNDSHKYLSLISEHKSSSMTKYINMLIKKDMRKNKELYDKLLKIENMKIEALKNI